MIEVLPPFFWFTLSDVVTTQNSTVIMRCALSVQFTLGLHYRCNCNAIL